MAESIPEEHYQPDFKLELIEDLAYFQEKSGFNPPAFEDKDPVDVFMEDLFFLGHRDIARLLRQDRDWFQVNDGYEGTGKSNSSMWACLFVDPKFYKRNIAIETQLKDILFDFKDIIRSLKGSRPYEAKNIDEGSKALFSREAMKDRNVDLIKTFTLCRQLNQFVNINAPTIWILDIYVRNFRVKTWHHNFEEYEKRGFVQIFRKNTSQWKKDPWFDLRAEAILPKFDNELWDIYKTKKQEYSVQQDSSKMYERNQAILKLVDLDISQADVGDAFSLSQQQISNIVKAWNHDSS